MNEKEINLPGFINARSYFLYYCILYTKFEYYVYISTTTIDNDFIRTTNKYYRCTDFFYSYYSIYPVFHLNSSTLVGQTGTTPVWRHYHVLGTRDQPYF